MSTTDNVAGRRALVTGATGFIGSNLVTSLLRTGWEVGVVVRATSALARLESFANQIDIYSHDGSAEQLCAIVMDAQPDTVFHLATTYYAQHCSGNIRALLHSNLVFATELLDAMANAGVKSLVNAGTASQHDYDGHIQPVSLYAATKQAFEEIIRYYVHAESMRITTLKLCDTYGPDDPRPKLIPQLIKAAVSGNELLMSPGEQLIDLMYVDDVTRAALIAAERLRVGDGEGHEEFGISSGQPISLKTLVSAIEGQMNRQVPVRWGARLYPKGQVMRPWTTGLRLPGWQPRVALAEGLQRTCAGFGHLSHAMTAASSR